MIKVQNLSYSYRDGGKLVSALRGIDLVIQRGEWVAITGANGSGKSTISRMFNGLLQPTEGSVTVGDLHLEEEVDRELVKQKIQLVFQNPDAQLVGTTPIEDVAFGLENRGISKEEIKARIEHVLQQVGLEHKIMADVSSLSGGQKQRLAIASCLALEPECLIFDEATSMLDPRGRNAIYQIARTLWKQGMTIIWITQRLEELLEADRVLVMERGKISYSGTPRKLFYESELPSRLGWDMPALIQVGYLLQERGVPAREIAAVRRGLGGFGMRIQLSGVEFRYETELVLQNVNLVIPSGNWWFFVDKQEAASRLCFTSSRVWSLQAVAALSIRNGIRDG